MSNNFYIQSPGICILPGSPVGAVGILQVATDSHLGMKEASGRTLVAGNPAGAYEGK